MPLTEIDNSMIGTHKDQTDLEWYVWAPIVVNCAGIGLLHVILSQIVRKYQPQVNLLYDINLHKLCVILHRSRVQYINM